MARWFAAVAPVAVDVLCGEERHRISWRRGRLVLHDHSLADEAVMRALGGAPPRCVAILEGWRDAAAWERANRPQPPGFVRNRPPPDVPDDLAALRRLLAVRSWERRWRRGADPMVVEDLYRVLRERARPPLMAHLEAARKERCGGPTSYVEVRMTEPAESPRVDGRIDRTKSHLVVWLAPAWLYARPPDGDADAEFRVDPTSGVHITWREIGDRSWKAEVSRPGGR